MTAFVIEKLARGHAVDAFDCGQEALNAPALTVSTPADVTCYQPA